MSEITLDGDPRRIAMAIYRAALDAVKADHGELPEPAEVHNHLQSSVPDLARQMVEAFDPDVRDVYLMNALELMALDFARKDF